MASTYKCLAQNAPSAATATSIYTVPASTSTVISSFIAHNTSTTATDTFKLAIRVANAADNIKQYIYGGNTASTGLAVTPLDTFVANIGITLAATDQVYIYSTNGTMSFSLFGTELT